jgi:hypothetical protein
MPGKLYTVVFTKQINPGSSLESEFQILSPGNRISIRRITIDWNKLLKPSLQSVPPDKDFQFLHLYVGYAIATGPQVFAQACKIISSTADTKDTGKHFSIHSAGAYEFDNFIISNEVNMRLGIVNSDVSAVQHVITIIIETNEKVIY